MQTVKLLIPIEIPLDFQNQGKPETIYSVTFAFYGPKMNTFGENFTVQVQVQDGENELTLFKAAITLAEAGMGTFDECVDALRKCNLDENAALMMLVDMRKEEASLYE